MAPLALLPAALSLLPDLARWIAGDTGGRVAQAAVAVVHAAAGTEDPAAALDAVRALPPAEAAALQIRLAEIAHTAEKDARAAELEALRATLADVAGARAQTVDLARAGSQVQWAPVLVSAIVLVSFSIVVWLVLTQEIPQRSEALANVLMGTLGVMATNVVAYWVGSSAGSAAKNALLMGKSEGK